MQQRKRNINYYHSQIPEFALKNADRVQVNDLDHPYHALFMHQGHQFSSFLWKRFTDRVKTKVNDLQIKPVSPLQKVTHPQNFKALTAT